MEQEDGEPAALQLLKRKRVVSISDQLDARTVKNSYNQNSHNYSNTDNSIDNSVKTETTIYNYQLLEQKTAYGDELKWLNAKGYFTRYAFFQGQRAPETGTWFIDHPLFKNWADAENGSKHILFCEGIRMIPGSLPCNLGRVVDSNLSFE